MSHADNLLTEYDRNPDPTRRRDIVCELVQIIREYDGELDKREETLDELRGAFSESCLGYGLHTCAYTEAGGNCIICGEHYPPGS